MKILITGGAGFIASHVADRFLADGHEVFLLDNLVTGSRRRGQARLIASTFPVEKRNRYSVGSRRFPSRKDGRAPSNSGSKSDEPDNGAE